jgi:hypothetical protein
MKRIILAATFLLLSVSASFAASEGFVVASCPSTLTSPWTAGQYGAITVDINGNQCTSGTGGGGGGGTSYVDEAAFTFGTSNYNPTGGVFTSSLPTALTNGQGGVQRMNAYRAGIVDVDTTNNNLYAAVTAAVPCLNATAFNTNTYTTGSTSPTNCDLHGNLYVNVGTLPALPANQSVNVAQVNGATTLTGAGATGTGAQRETVAQDTTTIAGSAPGVAGTPSTNVVSVQGASGGTPVPVNGTVSANGAANVTQNDCSGTVTTGGTAVNAFTAQASLHGFTIFNTNTTEVMWISFTTTAAAATAGSYPLPAPTATTYAGGGSYTSPPGQGTNHALSVVAATSGHTFSCTWW